MCFAEKLRSLRSERGLKQQTVAEKIGISVRAYQGYEQEGRYPRSRDIYRKLAEVLECDVNYLLTEETEPQVPSGNAGEDGKQQADMLVAALSGLFAGGSLSEGDKDAVMIALQKAYFDCKKSPF